ncbi:hypothetical protein POM88_036590 [Heracleum sosnowskyi]|uniref:BED-type domain-containing protein n=1 Tax=Heracleum sosnowskyi TaxID=360622 RepID=A0AAD8HQC0_9APIA|nr:hypothetical protein POM88_036590 [Heracleum sosnowskyi]
MKARKSTVQIEVIPKNVEFEENVESFGDETPSDDTHLTTLVNNKIYVIEKKSDIGSNSKEKVSGVTSEQGDKQADEVPVPYTTKTRKKKSQSWKYLEEFFRDGVKWARCTPCKTELKCGPTSSTSSLNIHVDKCKVAHGLGHKKLAQLQFQPGDSSLEVKIATFKYDHAEMRKTISHYIMVNELPFIHVESFMFNELMRKATPHWQKISRTTVKSDCTSTCEIEKKSFKKNSSEADRHLTYLKNVLNELYQEYYLENRVKSTEFFSSDNYINVDESETPQGIKEYENFVRESGAILEPMKSELDDYLAESIVISAPNSFEIF